MNELIAISGPGYGAGRRVLCELAEFEDRIVLAFVFGSVARGTERTHSDFDLLIVGSLDYLELGPVFERLAGEIGRQVDLNLHTPEVWGQLQGDRIIRLIVEGARLMVVDNVASHRQPSHPSSAQGAKAGS